MKLLIKKILITFVLIIVCIVGFTFLDISNDYICIKFQKTQYHKISWFLQRIDNGGFKKRKYKAVFLGSSQCYYGINDSILGKGNINLGMNTPSRDLDLYIKKRFIYSGGKADRYFEILGGDKVVSYGIHPLMPYLVKPNWLIANGQSFWSVHFVKYLINRFQVVCDYIAWAFFRTHDSMVVFNREYGVGYLDRITKRKQIVQNKNNIVNHEPYLNKNSVNLLDEFLHNTKSQWNFLFKNERLAVNNYLVIPSFETLEMFNYDVKKMSGFNYNLKLNQIYNIGFNEIINDSSNWADQGHLNRNGSIRLSKYLRDKIK